MGSSPVNRITDFALRQRLIDDGLQSKLDWVFFVLAAAASIWLTWIVATLGLRASPWQIPLWLLFWLVLAYLVLPRILAGLEVTRNDLARLGHGGMCMECKTCTFPKCPFGH